MSRINRRNLDPSYMGLLCRGGIFDAFDNVIKSYYRISDDEYDIIAEKASEDELGIFLDENPNFAQKRKQIELLNKYVQY